MSYSLKYAILLQVDGAIDPDGIGLSKATAAAALRKLANDVENGYVRVADLLKSPIDSKQEDRWVLRKIDEPGVIRGEFIDEWIRTSATDLNPKYTASNEEIIAYGIMWDASAIWMRPENLGQKPVLAGVWNEDGDRVAQLDLSDWLAWATEDDIAAGIRDGWNFTFAVDAAFSANPEDHDGRFDPLADDPNLLHAQSCGEDLTLAFVAENVPHARAYLNELRPGLIQSIEDDLDRRQQEHELGM